MQASILVSLFFRSTTADNWRTSTTGATGGVGKRVVQLLLQKGRRVRALVRDVDKARTLLVRHLRICSCRPRLCVSWAITLQDSLMTLYVWHAEAVSPPSWVFCPFRAASMAPQGLAWSWWLPISRRRADRMDSVCQAASWAVGHAWQLLQ